MSNRPVIAYDPATDGRFVTGGDNGPTFDVSPERPAWRPPLLAALILFPPALVWWTRSPGQSFGDSIWETLKLIFPMLVFSLAVSDDLFGVRRALMRVHAGGFVLEQSGWRKKRVLDVAWHEVKDVFVASGPRPVFRQRPHWLRIELIDRSPDEVVPLELMRDYAPGEIETVADALDHWRQNAAADRPPAG